ncbi:MAG: ketopantoate reductase family protein [Anaerolineae bacterium]|nr:ketopantoate reductase family protein [Anaerolineae bacterium]
MRVLVLGAGAVGTFVGGRLCQAGHPVTLVGRRSFVTAVRDHGIVLGKGAQATIVRDVRVFSSVDQAIAAGDRVDLVLLTVKAYDTASAAAELRSALREHASTWGDSVRILTLQNGVGNEETLLRHFSPRQVIAGAITTPVAVLEPGRVMVTRNGVVGISAVEPGSSLDDIGRALADAGFDITLYPDYRGLKWTKLLMNVTANATAAILGWPPERVLSDSRLAAIEIAVWREAFAVMAALDIRPVRLGRYRWPVYEPLIRLLPVAALRPFVRRMAQRGRGGKMPSLYIDLDRGRDRSEVEWLNGAVVSYGCRAGVATPVNRALVDVLLALVRREVPREILADRPGLLCAAVDAARLGRAPLSVLDGVA